MMRSPYQWLNSGALTVFPRNSFSYYWANAGLFYLYPLAGPGGWAAQVSHLWLGFVTGLAAAALARQAGADRRTAVLAAAVFAATPAVLEVASYAISELYIAIFATAAWPL